MRLIDADFIKEGIEYILNDSKELVTSSIVRNVMLGLVDRAKTVDAVAVVRCDECKEWTQTAGDDEFGLGRCEFLEHDLVMNKGFCAWGVRKDDAAD